MSQWNLQGIGCFYQRVKALDSLCKPLIRAYLWFVAAYIFSEYLGASKVAAAGQVPHNVIYSFMLEPRF
ncbi:hypothetical protein CS542_01985 [Pedobacter sp. IW39]|nr:hypothetical protein CS542_01985 [Pedobacter sp. IW39]